MDPKVIAALYAAQAELKNLVKTAVNPHFGNGYTPLPEFLDVVRPVLQKHDLVLIQKTQVHKSGLPVLVTMIFHKDGGEPIASEYPLMPARNDPQGLAGAHTYARRYDLKGVLGISEVDDDDDGNTASATVAKKKATRTTATSASTTNVKPCPIHNVPMIERQRQDGKGTFFAHKDGDTWCYGKAKTT